MQPFEEGVGETGFDLFPKTVFAVTEANFLRLSGRLGAIPRWIPPSLAWTWSMLCASRHTTTTVKHFRDAIFAMATIAMPRRYYTCAYTLHDVNSGVEVYLPVWWWCTRNKKTTNNTTCLLTSSYHNHYYCTAYKKNIITPLLLLDYIHHHVII